MILTALVVTYNRKILLERCLSALARQDTPPDRVIVVDNASTDGTREWLGAWLPINLPRGRVARMTENRGGAGGFSEGLRLAIAQGADWVWMMDDDAEPHPHALTELMRIATNPQNIYGSLATNGEETSWLLTLLEKNPRTVFRISDVPECTCVQMLPFLGFLIHRDLVAQIGLPDPGFFIAADDVEYCVRAQRNGAKVIVAGKSHIEHPKSRPYSVRLPGYTLTALQLPPWKRYYDTRNRLLIARRYYGFRWLTQTIPGSCVRLFAALLTEPKKMAQLRAWCCGMIDGIRGLKGNRHGKWGIGS